MKTKSFKKFGQGKHFLFFLMFCIFLLSFFFIVQFNKKITPHLLTIAETSINKLNETILTNYRVKDIYKDVALEDVIHITKNKKDEIISVDFQLENVYKALSIITEYLQKSIEDKTIRQSVLKYYDKNISSKLNHILLSIPIGVINNGSYFANLGPKIPVKINYMGYVSSSVRIKIVDYGINNVLVSIYIDCFLTNEFILPVVSQEIRHEYNILIASKIIQGSVPDYYGGVLESKSNILNVPLQ